MRYAYSIQEAFVCNICKSCMIKITVRQMGLAPEGSSTIEGMMEEMNSRQIKIGIYEQLFLNMVCGKYTVVFRDKQTVDKVWLVGYMKKNYCKVECCNLLNCFRIILLSINN